jgi:hypothetical protein
MSQFSAGIRKLFYSFRESRETPFLQLRRDCQCFAAAHYSLTRSASALRPFHFRSGDIR